jgi:hypothetical protein
VHNWGVYERPRHWNLHTYVQLSSVIHALRVVDGEDYLKRIQPPLSPGAQPQPPFPTTEETSKWSFGGRRLHDAQE